MQLIGWESVEKQTWLGTKYDQLDTVQKIWI